MNSAVTPQWIAKMYPGKIGRDHLGLGSVSSDQILPTLSPGINVLTFHPRYHSFYTFLLDEFWQRDRPRSYNAWVRFYRPRAFIFSVGAYLCQQPEHGEMGNVVGGQKTGPQAASELETYDTTYDYIKSALGGYGLYYRSVIVDLGLVFPGGHGFPYPVDVPSKRGKEVAAAFREAVKDTGYYREYFDDDETHVPIDVIREYIHQACLCQLQKPQAPDRSLLLNAFMHGGAEPEARRATLRMFLDIADQTQGHAIDEDVHRQLLYFQEADCGATYSPKDEILETYRRWRLYQAREYYGFALNALWYYLCDWGIHQGGDVSPIPISQFWQHLNQALDFKLLAAQMGVTSPKITADSDFQHLLDWLSRLAKVDAPSLDTAFKLNTPIHEHHLYWLDVENIGASEFIVTGMLALLALILLRFGEPKLRLQPEWAISRMGADGRLSVDGFVRSVRHRLEAGPFTVEDFAHWLYADYIILQHQLVATGKLPDNTFRFKREGDRLRFYNLENTLGFNSSRFTALSTTVYELGLCGDFRRPDHNLTPDGQRLLTEGDLT